MTREEAVRQLTINRPSAYTELREAISMAIKALEQQPVTLQMQTVIEYLINLIQKYGVRPSIEFECEPGAMWIRIKFSKNKKRITKMFYYVPVGEGTIENFRLYNPDFEFEILEMIDELRAKER
jgi:hypothetical protein